MDQLDLVLEAPIITGQAALSMLSAESLRRLLDRGLVKRGTPFYIMASRSGDIRTWTGKGQVPGWVRDLQGKGVELDALKVRI